MTYSFTEAEADKAHEQWGANCGPNALAFILQKSIEDVRYAIPGFAEKGYTSPTMMAAAIQNLGKTFTAYHGTDGKPSKASMFGRNPALVRIQWTGPWTQPGANPKWAYRQTHWIVAWKSLVELRVFDCNGGIRSCHSWVDEIVPPLTATYKRADGGWFPTHIWRIDQ